MKDTNSLDAISNLLEKNVQYPSSETEALDIARQYIKVLKFADAAISEGHNHKVTGYGNFKKEVAEQGGSPPSGLSYGTIRNRINSIEEAISKQKTHLYFTVGGSINQEKVLLLLECFYSWYGSKFTAKLKETTQEYDWEFLLYHHFIENESTVRAHGGIVRAILKLNTKTKEAFIKNINQHAARDYKGSFVRAGDTVVAFHFFGVAQEHEEAKKFELHIKTHQRMDKNNDELILGAYVSYENLTTIRTGTIVLLPISGVAPAPKFLCPFHNRREFLDVPLEIRRYLSKKELNLHKLPKDKFTLTDLKTWLDHKDNDRVSRSPFFSAEELTIFISMPVTGIETARHKGSKSKFESLRDLVFSIIEDPRWQEYKGALKFVFPASIGKKSSDSHIFRENLKIIKRSALFILIYTEPGLTSFSLVEFGYALAHSQRILLFCKRGSVPDQLLEMHVLNSDGIGAIRPVAINEDELDLDEISNAIQAEIDLIITRKDKIILEG